MSKIKTILEKLVQYADHGDIKTPTNQTVPTLAPGIYRIQCDMNGMAQFVHHNLVTDELLRFEDERHQLVLSEVKAFWGLKEKLQALGFTHKRGMLLYGRPGSGKSCLTKILMNDIVEAGDVVFIGKSTGSLRECLDQFRKVEPTRRCVVILEDVDKLVQYDEHTLLELFDGDSQVDGVLYIGTTNYLSRLPPRMLREGRFDRRIEIPFPPRAGRLAYFTKKLGLHETEDPQIIDDLADSTVNMGFGQLREFLISLYVYGYDPQETLDRIMNPPNFQEGYSEACQEYLDACQITSEEDKAKTLGESLAAKEMSATSSLSEAYLTEEHADEKIVESSKIGLTEAQKASLRRVAEGLRSKVAKPSMTERFTGRLNSLMKVFS